MPLREWFGPPRSLLTLYLAGAALAIACLAFLVLRQLEHETLVEQQRAIKRLESYGARVVAGYERQLNEFEGLLAGDPERTPFPSGVVIVRFDGVTFKVDRGALPFVPQVPTANQIATDAFEPAESMEFAGSVHEAARTYKRLARSTSPAMRAEALVRLGRVARRTGRQAEALAAYRELSELGDLMVSGRPADLVALRAECAMLPRPATSRRFGPRLNASARTSRAAAGRSALRGGRVLQRRGPRKPVSRSHAPPARSQRERKGRSRGLSSQPLRRDPRGTALAAPFVAPFHAPSTLAPYFSNRTSVISPASLTLTS